MSDCSKDNLTVNICASSYIVWLVFKLWLALANFKFILILENEKETQSLQIYLTPTCFFLAYLCSFYAEFSGL